MSYKRRWPIARKDTAVDRGYCTCVSLIPNTNYLTMKLGSKLLLSLILLVFIGQSLAAQAGHRSLRKGDRAYEEGNYSQAQTDYEKSLEANNSAQGNYNLGNSFFEQGEYEEAAKRYEEAAGLAEDDNIRSNAYRNLGDAYFLQQDFEKSVDAYKESLRIDPDDVETKYNLSKALRQLQQQQQQQQNQNQNQDQDQQEQNEQEQNQPQNQQGDQEGDAEQQNQEQEGQEQQQQNQPQNGQQSKVDRNQPNMSREEAERQLEIAAKAEKETMSRVQQGSTAGCNSKEEW